MMKSPDAASPEREQRWIESLRQLSYERWGRERTAAIEPVLEKTALAVAQVMALTFAKDDAPGFYLPVFEGDGSWRVQ